MIHKSLAIAVGTWLAVAGSPAVAQSIFSNPITDPNPSAANPFTAGQVVDPNLTVSGIGRGPGITANAGSNRYNAANWSSGAALDAGDYFTWTLTPNPEYEIDFTNFVYTGQRSGSGPTTFEFRSSLDGFTTSLGAPTATGVTVDLSDAQFQNVASSIEFRLYGYGSTSAAGTFSVNDFSFGGFLVFTPIPEPTTVGLLAAAGLGLARVARRRIVG